MNIFRTGVKWQLLLMMAAMGVLLGGAALLPDADAQANTPPTLTATALNKTFVEGGPAELLFENAAADTGDAGQLVTTLVVTVGDVLEPNSERLHFNGTSVQLADLKTASAGGVTATVSQSGSTSVVTFSFSPPVNASAFETFVNGLGYTNGANIPTEGVRTITLTTLIDDGATDNTTALAITPATVDGKAVNDDPLLVGLPASITVVEGVASNVDLSAGNFSDIDAPPADVTLTITASAGTLSGVDTGGVVATGSGTSTLVLTGQPVSINNYLNNAANIQYTSLPGAASLPQESLSFAADDFGNSGSGGNSPINFQEMVSIIVELPPESITVCLVKILGDNAGEITMPGDARFDVVVNGVAIDGQLQPTAGDQNCLAPQGAGAASFEVPAAASFTITEADTTPGVGPIDISCAVSEIEVTTRPVDGVLATRSVNVDLAPNENEVECTFVNDTIPVCVSKRFGDGAQALFDAGMASIEDVEFALDDGPSEVPGFDCNEIPSIEYFVAPGSTFTITETIADGSPMRPVDISCFQGETAVGVGELGTASVTVATSVEQLGTIRCTFTNDALIVCVTKTLGFNAAAFKMPDDFTFDLALAGEAPQQLIPNPQDPLCGGQELRVAINSSGTVGVALPPGTAFSIAEQDPGPRVGLVDAYCDAGESTFELTEGTSTIEVPALEGISRVDCYFFNESVLVCVQKYSFTEPFDFDFGPTFTATSDGESVDVSALGAPDEGSPCRIEGGEFFFFYVAPDSAVVITETLPAGSPVGLVYAACSQSGGQAPTLLLVDDDNQIATLDGQTVSFMVDGPGRVDCEFENAYQVVCVTKSVLAGAVIAGHTASDFDFDVTFDGTAAPMLDSSRCEEGETDTIGFAALAVVPDTTVTTAFAVAPNTTVTVQELGSSVEGALAVGPHWIACDVNNEVPVAGDVATGSVSFESGADASTLDCLFENDTLIVCVVKEVNPTAIDAGFTADLAEFTVVDGETVVEPFDTQCDGPDNDTRASVAYALVPDQEGTVTITEAPTVFDAHVGLVAARCFPGLNFSTSDLETRTIVSPKQHGGDSVLRCEFVNDSVEVTLTKSLVLDDGRQASAGDFVFDVYDSDGEAIESALATGATFYVAPGTTFTISERVADGFTTTASCVDRDLRSPLQALDVNGSVTHTPGEFVEGVDCTFVNDDIAPIPVCAMLILEEGTTDFTLDDFSLELFKAGAIVGQRSAGDPFDAACEDTTDNTASLLPGSLVQLGKVFADGSSFAFAVSVADPDGLLEFEPSSCSVDAPAATQALAGADPVTFTVDPGTTRVTCVARANAKPPVVGSSGGLPGGRPPFVEPVVGAAAAAPAPEAAQVVAVAVAAPAPIAVTGSSTTGVTLPAAFGLLSAGFVGLGLDRRRRNRNELG